MPHLSDQGNAGSGSKSHRAMGIFQILIFHVLLGFEAALGCGRKSLCRYKCVKFVNSFWASETDVSRDTYSATVEFTGHCLGTISGLGLLRHCRPLAVSVVLTKYRGPPRPVLFTPHYLNTSLLNPVDAKLCFLFSLLAPFLLCASSYLVYFVPLESDLSVCSCSHYFPRIR
ncbi:hypothetical protein HDV63DRAFT_326085 [Trichoderma sp. SZMC 28014]